MKKKSETAAQEGGQRGQQRRSRDNEAAGASSDGQPAAGAASSGAGFQLTSPFPLEMGMGGLCPPRALWGPHSKDILLAWFGVTGGRGKQQHKSPHPSPAGPG